MGAERPIFGTIRYMSFASTSRKFDSKAYIDGCRRWERSAALSAVEQSKHGRPSTDVESPPDAPIRIGISSCLLGEHVRFDGGHKRDAFLVDTFGRYVEWVPVCPEVEVGMGMPRESMRLRRDRG